MFIFIKKLLQYEADSFEDFINFLKKDNDEIVVVVVEPICFCERSISPFEKYTLPTDGSLFDDTKYYVLDFKATTKSGRWVFYRERLFSRASSVHEGIDKEYYNRNNIDEHCRLTMEKVKELEEKLLKVSLMFGIGSQMIAY